MLDTGLQSFKENFQEALHQGLPLPVDESTRFSLPALLHRGDSLLDAMFVYRMPEVGASGRRPFAWLALDAASGMLSLCADCGVLDFADSALYPMNTPVDLTLPEALEPREYDLGCSHYLQEYEELRTFAFQPDPDPWQQDRLETCKSLFLRHTYLGHRPFYLALSPEYFRWLGLWQRGGSAARPQEQLLEGQRRTLLALDELTRLFQNKLAVDKHKEGLFDALHQELSVYKSGLLEQLTRPMELDIIGIIDDIEGAVESYRGREPTRENYSRFFALFEGVRTDLCDLLYRHGVEPYSVQGNAVEIQRQKVLATLPTADPARDKTTAQRHGPGWEKEGRVIRPQRITAYVYTPGETEPQTAETGGSNKE